MTILEIQKQSGVIPNIDLDLLLAESIHQKKEYIFSHPEYKLSLWEYLRFRYFFYKYSQGYSVAAILGHKEFRGLDFYVNKNVLIPRPETELMVENAIEEMKKINKEIILVDVGTGSGCIPISILKSGIPNKISTYALDISGEALRIARKNIIRHNVKINLIHSNLLTSFLSSSSFLSSLSLHHFIITANLPYLTESQFKSEKSIQKEPKKALISDNKDGLEIYEKLLKQIQQLKNEKTIFLEIDPSQSGAINFLVSKYLPNAKSEIQKDLSGQDRLVVIR